MAARVAQAAAQAAVQKSAHRRAQRAKSCLTDTDISIAIYAMAPVSAVVAVEIHAFMVHTITIRIHVPTVWDISLTNVKTGAYAINAMAEARYMI